MGALEEELANYKEVGGLYFHLDTPSEVANLIAGYVDGDKRIHLDFGDITTGESWSLDAEVEGYVRKSTGEIPVPVLLPTARSNAGSPVACEHIVSIWGTDGSRVYKHPDYSPKFNWPVARISRSSSAELSKTPWQILAVLWKTRNAGQEQVVTAFGTEGQAMRWLTKKRKFERV